MAQRFWLASYPKSGNTWVRIFLANLLFPARRPLDLNDLPLVTTIASSRSHFDWAVGVPSAFLTDTEIAVLRPCADQAFRCPRQPLEIRKIHDAFAWLPDGRPMFGRAPERSAILVIRDPWDIAVSMAHHFSMDPHAAADRLLDPNAAVATESRGLPGQLPQRLLSWRDHTLSWLNAPMPVHLVRFEEMKADPLRAFRGITEFLGLDFDDVAIAEAAEESRIERLQRQERKQRFRETGPKAPNFFRSGNVGDGRSVLAPDQLLRLAEMKSSLQSAFPASFAQ